MENSSSPILLSKAVLPLGVGDVHLSTRQLLLETSTDPSQLKATNLFASPLRREFSVLEPNILVPSGRYR